MDNLDHHHNGHHHRHDEDNLDHHPSSHDEDNLDHHPSRHQDDPHVCRARDDANGHDDGDRVTHEDEHGSGPFPQILPGRLESHETR